MRKIIATILMVMTMIIVTGCGPSKLFSELSELTEASGTSVANVINKISIINGSAIVSSDINASGTSIIVSYANGDSLSFEFDVSIADGFINKSYISCNMIYHSDEKLSAESVTKMINIIIDGSKNIVSDDMYNDIKAAIENNSEVHLAVEDDEWNDSIIFKQNSNFFTLNTCCKEK